MTVDSKDSLIDLLSATHSKIQKAVDGVDLELYVYEDGSWRVRDVLGHIATWDRQVSLSLQAYCQGKEYAIPEFDEDRFNQEDVKRQRALFSEQIYKEWQEAREIFMGAVRNIPEDLLPGDLLYPWGDERGTAANLVKDMCSHDEEHYAEIMKAVADPPKG